MTLSEHENSGDLKRILSCVARHDALPDASLATGEGGAYLLLIEIGRSVGVTVRRNRLTLPPGSYIYCGSAYGPGGIRARLRHHMARSGTAHWHVDQLTRISAPSGLWAITSGSECGLVSALAGRRGFHFPVPGFGSSDCKCCPSHLLAFEPGGPRR